MSNKRKCPDLEAIIANLQRCSLCSDWGRNFRTSISEDPSLLLPIMEALTAGETFSDIMHKQKGSIGGEEGLDISTLLTVIKKHCPTKADTWKELVKRDELSRNMTDIFRMKSNSDDFWTDGAVWSKNPLKVVPDLFMPRTVHEQKRPNYVAFSGASGSGKTYAMCWTCYNVIKEEMPDNQDDLTLYISCQPKADEDVYPYVEGVLKEQIERLCKPFELSDFNEQCKNTWLVLILDEVPNRWSHQSYHRLPKALIDIYHFQRVVLVVGGTGISYDVIQQTTSSLQVINIRMKPVPDERAQLLLLRHLTQNSLIEDKAQLAELVMQLWCQMPVLVDLVSNHRCARLTAEVLAELLGKIVQLPDGWCQGHGPALLSTVACKYRALNGLKNKSHSFCSRVMMDSLALTAAQSVIQVDTGVEKHPKYLESTREVVESGLVERAILPDEALDVNAETHFKVDGDYEWQMSPALTLLCASATMPWLEGLSSAADHFEGLVAVLAATMRYAQTGKLYKICRLASSVPYHGNDKYLYHEPSDELEETCLINGPQAPYADLMVAGTPKPCKTPSGLAMVLSEWDGANAFPVESLLVQCKLTGNEETEASATFKK